jgi:hypothetical protein
MYNNYTSRYLFNKRVLTMRNYIRHPSDIPIAIREKQGEETPLYASNISYGGLALVSDTPYLRGKILTLEIELVEPAFITHTRVAWCQKDGRCYHIGVEFMSQEDVYAVRLVEQICHIEQYKKNVYRWTGKRISNNQAAKEWIGRHAADFPGGMTIQKHRTRSGKS